MGVDPTPWSQWPSTAGVPVFQGIMQSPCPGEDHTGSEGGGPTGT